MGQRAQELEKVRSIVVAVASPRKTITSRSITTRHAPSVTGSPLMGVAVRSPPACGWFRIVARYPNLGIP